MRQEEIFRVTWDDYNPRTKMLLIRDRKDPSEKKGNHQRIPLLDISGYNAVDLIEEQRAVRSNEDDPRDRCDVTRRLERHSAIVLNNPRFQRMDLGAPN